MKEQKHILVVDDDKAIQDAIQSMLELKGYRTSVLTNGDSLLREGALMPDLYILDKQLPGVDGLEICRYLKAQESTKRTPVIIMSASPQIGRQAKEVCADDFIEKPFKISVLAAMIEKSLSKDAQE